METNMAHAPSPRPQEPNSVDMLAWYDRHRRDLPWRAPPGTRPDPYHVWLSEIMLQQTTVATVKGYFEAFLQRWPTIADLAAAPLDDVLHAWQGLGYYARARNLHKCARAVVADHAGRFPANEAELQDLPGIGPYTAAAIAAIAFDLPATPMDGNIERVMARIHAIETPLPAAKPELKRLATHLTPEQRPGDYAQALMDLGATVCTPRNPRCILCPWTDACRARADGDPARLPTRLPKAAKPVRRGAAFWLLNPKGEVLLRRRPDSGLLGGMIEVPSGPWQESADTSADTSATVLAGAPVQADWRELPGEVRHTFTHFHLRLRVLVGRADGPRPAGGGFWCSLDRLGDHALPTVMKKVVRHVAAHA